MGRKHQRFGTCVVAVFVVAHPFDGQGAGQLEKAGISEGAGTKEAASIPSEQRTLIRLATPSDAEVCGRICFEAFGSLAAQHAISLRISLPPKLPSVSQKNSQTRNLSTQP